MYTDDGDGRSVGKKNIFNSFVIRFSVDAGKTTMAGRKTLRKAPPSARRVSIGGKRIRRDIIIIIIIMASAIIAVIAYTDISGLTCSRAPENYATRTPYTDRFHRLTLKHLQITRYLKCRSLQIRKCFQEYFLRKINHE